MAGSIFTDFKSRVTVRTVGVFGCNELSSLSAVLRAMSFAKYRSSCTFIEHGIIRPKGIYCPLNINVDSVEYELENNRYLHIEYPSFADYVKDMIVNFNKNDVTILVTSAKDGLSSITREQVRIAADMGMRYILLFIDHCDIMCDDDLLCLIEMEAECLLSDYGLNFPYAGIRGSVSKAIEDYKNEKFITPINDLLDDLDNISPSTTRDENSLPFLMQIEDVSYDPDRGTVVKGKVTRGTLNIGDSVDIVGLRDGRKEAVITGTNIFNTSVDFVQTDDDAVFVLKDIQTSEVEIGQVLSRPHSIEPCKKFKAEIYMLSSEEGGRTEPIVDGYCASFHFYKKGMRGLLVFPTDREKVMPGEHLSCEVNFADLQAIDVLLKFTIMEDEHAVGIGVITKILGEI